MAGPKVPIDVDPETGIWLTDGLPMVYVPRHFLVNNHMQMEAALGRDALRAELQQSGDRSALFWCQAESRRHGLRAEETVRHYLTRLSQRGWGRFDIVSLDPEAGTAEVTLDHSIFVLQAGRSEHPVCYMFEGFISGAFRHILAERGRRAVPCCDEVDCAAVGNHVQCRFTLRCTPPPTLGSARS